MPLPKEGKDSESTKARLLRRRHKTLNTVLPKDKGEKNLGGGADLKT